MTQGDFNSSFRNLLNEPLPPAPDPRQIAFELFRRDQQRTRILAVLSLLFWVVGTAGIFLLVANLNHIVMESQVHSYAAPRPSVFQPPQTNSGTDGMNLAPQGLHPIALTKICAVVEMSVVALLIAALLTVSLVFSSRQATLNRINISLMQIAEQLSRAPQAAAPPGGVPPGILYSLPPASGRWGTNALIKILIVLAILLLLGVPILWLAARATAARHEAMAMAEVVRARANMWRGYPELSPFEAVQWKGTTPCVQVGGKWYELLSIDGLPADHVVALCQTLDPDNWQKRFEEDLVEVLMRGGHPIGNRTTLEVKDLESGEHMVLKDVKMTEENRQALWRAGTTRPSAPSLTLGRTGGGE